MQVYIDSDELYPYYFIGDNWRHDRKEVEIADETVERWKRITNEWVDVQVEMARAVKGENPWGYDIQ